MLLSYDLFILQERMRAQVPSALQAFLPDGVAASSVPGISHSSQEESDSSESRDYNFSRPYMATGDEASSISTDSEVSLINTSSTINITDYVNWKHANKPSKICANLYKQILRVLTRYFMIFCVRKENIRMMELVVLITYMCL